MKKSLILLIVAGLFFLLTGCATIEKKNILLIYSGLGVDVYYKSNACPDIPGAPKGPAEFIIPAGQVEE
ncbi:MAG: hypothetical protein HON48_22345 [Desulfobacula sp.]|jgi:hypothetical protein|nr:hypothetical protein [Desulfobacula sp.]